MSRQARTRRGCTPPRLTEWPLLSLDVPPEARCRHWYPSKLEVVAAVALVFALGVAFAVFFLIPPALAGMFGL